MTTTMDNNSKFEFSCNYSEKDLLDGYKDRKILIRYRRAVLGTIALMALAFIFSKSSYVKIDTNLFTDRNFVNLTLLVFMVIFTGNNHKFMWNSMSNRTYSATTSNYNIHLYEDYIDIDYTLSGIKKKFKYNEVKIYEVKNYFLLENEFLNGYYIPKKDLNPYELNDLKSFLKSKAKFRNLNLPFILRNFARMNFVVDILIVILLLVPIGLTIKENESVKNTIGERVVCQNMGVTVKDAGRTSPDDTNHISLYKVTVTLECFQKSKLGPIEYSSSNFHLISPDNKQFLWFTSSDPNSLPSGKLKENESVTGTLYFNVPLNYEPEYLLYVSPKGAKYNKKIYLHK